MKRSKLHLKNESGSAICGVYAAATRKTSEPLVVDCKRCEAVMESIVKGNRPQVMDREERS